MTPKRTALTLTIFTALFLTHFAVLPPTATSQTTTSESSYPSYKIGGFLQQQFIADETSGSPTRFYTHRARIGVTGSVTDRISVNFIGGYTEPPHDNPKLVNAFIHFDIDPLFQVRTGQFFAPFGLEGPEPIPLNPAIERSTAIRQLNTFALFRDVGIQVSGSNSGFSYAIAVLNGTGANRPEQIDPKDVVGRIGFDVTNELAIGVSGHFGQYQTGPSTDDHESRFRSGADISYKGSPLFLRGEYIIREDDLPEGGSIKMNGGYLLGGYELTDALETIVRYEYYEPNTDVEDNHFTVFTIGANYYFVGNTRISANYELRDNSLNPAIKNLFTVQMQLTL